MQVSVTSEPVILPIARLLLSLVSAAVHYIAGFGRICAVLHDIVLMPRVSGRAAAN